MMSRSRILAFVELVAPDDDGLEGQRAFAQAGDHRLAAGLDALGDGDLALARQQLDRAHVAQVHAHGIVGALGRLGARAAWSRARRGVATARPRPPPRRRRRRRRPGAAASSPSSLSTTVMPMSDSIDIVSSICSEDTSSEGSTAVELVIGDVAARLGGLEKLLDRLIGQVEQRAIALLASRCPASPDPRSWARQAPYARSRLRSFRFDGHGFQGL